MDESDRFLVTSQESERYQQLAQYLTFNDESDYFGFQNKKTLAYSYPTHLDIFGSSRKVRETNREEPNEHKEETVISVAISKALGNFNLVIESLKFTC